VIGKFIHPILDRQANMRAKTISVTKLFGIFNHKIPLNLDEHITIIHGPNGFGKTVLLRMVDGLLKSNYMLFRRIPFDEFKIEFDDQEFISVNKALEGTMNGSR
jgi:predicted ATP-binding protein involved in virulence